MKNRDSRKNFRPKVVLLIETSSMYGRDLLRGVTTYCRTYGQWIICNVPNWKISFNELKHCDGIIARDQAIINDHRKVEAILSLGIPTILSQSYKQPELDVNYIATNNEKIGKIAVDYFNDRGLSSLAYCGIDSFYWSAHRGESFMHHARSHGFEVHYFKSKPFSRRLSRKEEGSLLSWLTMLPKPTGVLCCNDERAKQVLELCRSLEIVVPDDLSVLGVDNDDLICDICEPPLSSIRFNAIDVGFSAAALLDSIMRGEPVEKKTLFTEPIGVKTRQSTDIFSCKDVETAKALRFISRHCRELIQVDDVVNATALCRRSLQKRFKTFLGHSIHEQIMRVKVDAIADLLLETNMNITEAARLFGFEYINNVSRAFKKIKGINPHDFRKTYGKASQSS